MSIQRWLNMPLRAARTVSPGERVLVIATSQPPVPVAGKMKISAEVERMMVRTPALAGCRMSAKAEDR
jgi:hypothetical protein